MKKTVQRIDGRSVTELRPLTLSVNTYGYADGSVVLACGDTKVLCTVSLQHGVPPFLRGKKTGWLTAEYAMLPTATHTRRSRISGCKRDGRSIEISRLIGRSLRTVTSLDLLGEKTIFIDCDVLQADGSTRTLCVSGAYAALKIAQDQWLDTGVITEPVLTDEVAAVSVGCSEEQVFVDLNFAEDSRIDADFNFVLTRSGTIIELQGTAEKKGVSWQQFEHMRNAAVDGVQQFFTFLDKQIALTQKKTQSARRAPLFSLSQRNVTCR